MENEETDIMSPDFIYPHREIIEEEQIDMNALARKDHPFRFIAPVYVKLESDIKGKGDAVTKEEKTRLVMRSLTLQSELQKYADADLPEATDELINQIEKENMEKEQKEKFDAAMAKAKQLMESKDWNGAKAAYQEALAIDPASTECTEAIAAIDATVAAEATKAAEDAEKEKNKTAQANFDTLIASGDALFAEKKYKDARSAYNEAAKIMTNDTTASKLAAVDTAEAADTPPPAGKTPAAKKTNAVQDAIEDLGLEW